MKILNLGCGAKVSQDPDVLNIDWSPKHILAKLAPSSAITKLFGKDNAALLSKIKCASFKLHDLRRGIPANDNSIDAVYHSHVLEHLDRKDVDNFFSDIYRVLKPGGIHRIVVPDFQQICASYMNSFNLYHCKAKSLDSKHEDTIAECIEQSVRKDSAAYTVASSKFEKLIQKYFFGDARSRGETHQWMYDFYSLKYILKSHDFSGIEQVAYSKSNVKDWIKYGLDTDINGNEYKPRSLYVECFK